MSIEISALGEREILALAISLEAEDVRIYTNLAEALREGFPKLATILDSMRGEESARAHFS
jgi:rubrerythrin